MTRRASLIGTAAILALAAAGPAAAGFHCTASERIETAAGTQTMSIEAWAAHGDARIEIKSGGAAAGGAYLLLRGGGKSLYVVDPAAKTYMRSDMQSGLAALGSKLGVSDPKVEKLLDEDGGTMLGYPTRHSRYRITYKTRVQGSADLTGDVVMEKETWAAPGVPDEGFEAWLRTGEVPGGGPEFEKLLAGMRDTMKGLPLRVKITNTSTLTILGKTNPPSVFRFEVDLTSLETTPLDDSRFELPAGYQEKPLPTAQPPVSAH